MNEPFLYYLREGRNEVENEEFSVQKKYVNKLLIKSLQNNNLNILIGSGCSLPAVNLMGDTFNALKTQEGNALFTAIEYGGENKDIEGYLNWLNMGINFYEKLELNDTNLGFKNGLERSFNITKQYLIESIVDDYSGSDGKVAITKSLYHSFYNALFSFRELKDFSPVNVYTTNYDLFNEVAMEDLDIYYTNGFTGSVIRKFDPTTFQLRLVDDENRYKEKWSILRRYIKLYKIHGSIDWVYSSEYDSVIQTNNKDIDAKDILIYPTIDKHIETQQTPYSELFRALSVNLQKPNSTLIVLGYGFPDQHINHLISQSLSNEDFNLVVFGNKDESNAAAFIERHKHKTNFHFIGGSIHGVNDGHYFSNVISYLTRSEMNQ
ncbi:SIR2 family protein [Sporosarcina luteola]|uniref:SIR2 family protein n=1 Tax=Sporosarcina luteola TaxID=582850 RepID=UPI0020403717|nr:SIR2 family protein [Sporosarcina luteola]MCM3745361.1 SIR2 family protein [Sporosarcina luteola]